MPPSFILLQGVAENFRLEETNFRHVSLQYSLRNTDISKLTVRCAFIYLRILGPIKLISSPQNLVSVEKDK